MCTNMDVHACMLNVYQHGCACVYVECVPTWMYVHVCSHFRWLKQEYEIPFPLDKQPPVHMPIAYGLVDIQKTTSSEKTRPRSQVASLGRNVHGTDVASMGFQGNNSHEDTSEERQCSLCSSDNEVGFFMCSMTHIITVCCVVEHGAGG